MTKEAKIRGVSANISLRVLSATNTAILATRFDRNRKSLDKESTKLVSLGIARTLREPDASSPLGVTSGSAIRERQSAR